MQIAPLPIAPIQAPQTAVPPAITGKDAPAQAAGPKNMLCGALWCIGGIVVTAATYSVASETGGRYIVAWGAILFGGLQFLQGLFQTCRDS